MSQNIYDKIMMLAKRRGYIYPSFEIYGGVAGFYDYGPLGSRLKINVENLWRKFFLLKDNCIEIDTPTITLHDVLKASGHIEEFTDLTVDCKKCKRSYKVGDIIDNNISVDQAIKEEKIKCPTCGTKIKDAHPVNLMFSTTIGGGEGRAAFLRPETAQGIFTNFHLLYRYNREQLPFGVIQIGKGYRNEISPRQGMLRLREFSMAEAEVFFDPENKIHPDFDNVKNKKLFLFDNKNEYNISLEEAINKNIIDNQALAYYMYLTKEFLFTTGIDPKKFRFRKHGPNELAHYATECWDAEIHSERFGWIECVGIADRSAYDLNAHIESTGIDMYALKKFSKTKIVKVKKIIPKMNELGPLFKDKASRIKALLEKIDVKNKMKVSVDLDGKTIEVPEHCYDIVDIQAPIKTGIFPLINEKNLVNIAKEADKNLRNAGIETYYDEGGTIGRRYARMDEIGTPFCITVDHDTLNDKKVTIRDRDTTRQERINSGKLINYFQDKFKF